MELPRGEHYHNTGIRLNTARSCIEYVLRLRSYRKVYIPYFTCETAVQPFKLLGVDYEFYTIDSKLEPVTLPDLKDGEAFLYTNYFGLKQDCVERLAMHFGERLIVDNAQAFYAEPIPGIDTFYSARKFFGVPDGAYLYCTKEPDPVPEQDGRRRDACVPVPEQDISYQRMSHLLKRVDLGAESGYSDFRHNDDLLAGLPIMRMSRLTERLLGSIDYQSAKEARRSNYEQLEKELGRYNKLVLTPPDGTVPMVYPFMADDANLKQKLIGNKIFVATYWPNVFEWCAKNTWEYTLAEQGCFLPVDQRYGRCEMERIIDTILG